MADESFLELLSEAIALIPTDERNQEILRLRLGLGRGEARKFFTLAEIGDRFGISRERVRQIIVKMIRSLRSHGMRDIKAGKDSALARLVERVQSLKAHDDWTTYIRLIDFVEQEMAQRIPRKVAFELVNRLVFTAKQREDFKYFYTSILKYRKPSQPGDVEALKEQKATHKITNLFADVIWTPQDRHWTPEQFKFKIPALLNKTIRQYYFISQKLGREVGAATQTELKFFKLLEDSAEIAFYLERPFGLAYEFEGRQSTFYPDVFCLLKDGRGVVIDTKPTYELGLPKNLAKWKALRQYCTEKGMGLLVTDLRYSIQRYQQFTVTPAFEKALLDRLSIGCIRWREYCAIRDEHEVRATELLTLALKRKVVYQFRPFLICLGENNPNMTQLPESTEISPET
jgi:hypothetical protein